MYSIEARGTGLPRTQILNASLSDNLDFQKQKNINAPKHLPSTSSQAFP